MPSKPDVSIRVVSALDEGFINVVRRILPESGFSSTRFVTKPEGVESGFRDPWLALEACRDSRLLGGVLAELHLDGTAHAVVPRMAAGDSRSTCCVLLNRLMQELAGRGINLITVYVSMEDAETPLYLADAGFRRTHDLQVMCAPTEAVARPANRQRWVIRSCPEPVSSTLRATFARTLVGTFDFPDLRIEAPIDR
ncbi:MAG: hypothetical protein JJ992_28005, partial [Planctomycetes bacterium]|nr:hypothetical protein [Planctomycetota bacterium]